MTNGNSESHEDAYALFASIFLLIIGYLGYREGHPIAGVVLMAAGVLVLVILLMKVSRIPP